MLYKVNGHPISHQWEDNPIVKGDNTIYFYISFKSNFLRRQTENTI